MGGQHRMKKIVYIPSIEKEQNKNPLQLDTILKFEKIMNILRNNEYKITFHPSINGVIAWKPQATENLVNLIVLNYFNGKTADFIEFKKWSLKILNTLYEKPEALLSDIKFKILAFPFAGKVKIPYVNNFPAKINISTLVFGKKLYDNESMVISVQNSNEFSEILKKIERSQHEMNHVDFSNFHKMVVRFFTFLSVIWGAAFIFSLFNVLPPITIITTTLPLIATSFIFTVVKTRKALNEIKTAIFYQNKNILSTVQHYSPIDITSCFVGVVEAFLSKDWLKFDSLAKHLLNLLFEQGKMDAEIHRKMNMLKEILSTDISLRNESSHFFVLSELSKVLKELNLLEFNVNEIFEGKVEPKAAETEVMQKDNGWKETLEKTKKTSSSVRSIQENSNVLFSVDEGKAAQLGSDSKDSMGVVFHPVVSSVDDFIKTFERKTGETIIGEQGEGE